MTKVSCEGCGNGQGLDFDFTMAFQPIFSLKSGQNSGHVWGYEALVRGIDGQSAGDVLAHVTPLNRYRFDQACRVKAITLAGELFPRETRTKLSINFLPNAVYEPSACIKASLAAAGKVGFDPHNLMFEFTEGEHMEDVPHVRRIVEAYRRMGFVTAIDDFGAGHAGLVLLAKLEPDLIKIDMELVRGIESSPVRQAIIASITQMARSLDMTVIAEGIETEAELMTLKAAGITLFQGYLLARPGVAKLPAVTFSLAA